MGMIYAPPSIIPNGALINDVCHFYQSTKPTTRTDGSALVIGDIWYNTGNGDEGFWNGTYWLGPKRNTNLIAVSFNVIGSGSGAISYLSLRNQSDFLESIDIFYLKTAGVLDANNRYDISFHISRNDGIHTATTLGTFSINKDSTGAGLQGTVITNLLVSENNNVPLSGFKSVITAIGTPGGVRYSPIFYVRAIL